MLVVGLGNPGDSYSTTRHNVGFLFVERLADKLGASWKKKFQGQFAEGRISGAPVQLLKPETYMNLSGQSVSAAMQFLKIPLSDVLVVHDDLDLAPAKIKMKTGGGAGGHNGLKSIDQIVGKDYARLRIGIGHPRDRIEKVEGSKPALGEEAVARYVLAPFSKAERSELEPVLDALVDEFELLVGEGHQAYLNAVALKMKELGIKESKEKS